MSETIFEYRGDGWWPDISPSGICFGGGGTLTEPPTIRYYDFASGQTTVLGKGQIGRFIDDTHVTVMRPTSTVTAQRYTFDCVTHTFVDEPDDPTLVAGNMPEGWDASAGNWASWLDLGKRIAYNNQVLITNVRGVKVAGDLLLTAGGDKFLLYERGVLKHSQPLPPTANNWTLSKTGEVGFGYWGPAMIFDAAWNLWNVTVTPWKLESPPLAIRLPNGQTWVWTFSYRETDGMNMMLGRPWGEKECIILEDFPAASFKVAFRDDHFYVAGNNTNGHLKVVKVHVNEKRRLVEDINLTHIEDTSGQTVNMWEYIIPDTTHFFPRYHSGERGHPMHMKWDGRNLWTLPFGEPDHWIRWVIENGVMRHREDHSRDGQNTGDWSFTDAIWAKQFMKPRKSGGEVIDNANNVLVRYNPDTCEIVDIHKQPFKAYLYQVWKSYYCGRDLGWREVAVLAHEAGNEIELQYFAKGGPSYFKFQVIDRNNQTQVKLETQFELLDPNGRRLEPTPGCWKPEHLKLRPKEEEEDMAFPQYTVPHEIYLGAYGQFIDNLLPRDRILNATAEDGVTVEEKISTRGSMMYFNIHYYNAVNQWIANKGRLPKNFDEWGAASMHGLIAANTAYDREQKGVPSNPNPGPGPVNPPSSDLDRMVGQVKIENGGGFVDATGPKLPILCHVGDLFSVFVRNRDRAREILGFIAQAGYHGIRFWTILGPGSNFWTGREVWEGNTPNYWGQLRNFLMDVREFGLVAFISQGDVRPEVIPNRRDFAYKTAEILGQVGPDVCFLWEAANESRDTGERDARKLAEFAYYFKEHRPEPLIALSAYTGHEDVAITNDFSRAPADIYTVHGYRDARWWDKIRHIFSFAYEGKPNKRLGIQGEPVGPGSDVSASQNKQELDADVLCLMAGMSLLSRQAWVYMSGPGVRTDVTDERLEQMPGFWEVPKVRAYMPQDVMRYEHIFHGGAGRWWESVRVFEPRGEGSSETRCDHAYHPDGRFVCIIYGNEARHVRQLRNVRIDGDQWFGDKGRIVYGQG